MALFGFGKKKEEKEFPAAAKETDCGCGCNAATAAAETARCKGACVKVLGSGCAKCNALEAAAVQALAELRMDTAIDHVTDFAEIAAYGVMSTPALVVDGKVVAYGKVLKKDEIVKLLKEQR